MKYSYTPKPWYVGVMVKNGYRCVYAADGDIQAKVPITRKESALEALLVANAPQLLDLLRTFVAVSDEPCAQGWGGRDGECSCCYCEAHKLLKQFKGTESA